MTGDPNVSYCDVVLAIDILTLWFPQECDSYIGTGAYVTIKLKSLLLICVLKDIVDRGNIVRGAIRAITNLELNLSRRIKRVTGLETRLKHGYNNRC